jgi:hypothetical protein
MSDDDFLSRYREEPRPELASGLSRRLHEIDAEDAAAAPRRARRRAFTFASLAAAAVVVASILLPPVRAAARSFLDLFRVKRFAAVPVDPERLSRLQQSGLDIRSLVSGQLEVIDPARRPEPVDGFAAAAGAAGITVRQPAALPRGAAFASVAVGHPGAFRLRLDVPAIEELARAAGVEDPDIPAEWDGTSVEVHAPPVVVARYHRDEDDFVLLQSRAPEIALPQGVDIRRLGTLGLRVAGMSPEEARLFGRTMDWRGTLLVPIPLGGGSFRDVDVHGQKGLLVTTLNEGHGGHPSRGGRWRSVLLWAEGDEVLALSGPGQGLEVLEMAQGVR